MTETTKKFTTKDAAYDFAKAEYDKAMSQEYPAIGKAMIFETLMSAIDNDDINSDEDEIFDYDEAIHEWLEDGDYVDSCRDYLDDQARKIMREFEKEDDAS